MTTTSLRKGAGTASSTTTKSNRAAQRSEHKAVEELLYEFNEGLRLEGHPHFEILERCPEPQRRELLALMNVATLAWKALEPERKAHRAALAKKTGVAG
jgi:hypothetical protein